MGITVFFTNFFQDFQDCMLRVKKRLCKIQREFNPQLQGKIKKRVEERKVHFWLCLMISRIPVKTQRKSSTIKQQTLASSSLTFFQSYQYNIMKDIKDFFQCCGYSNPQPEIVITMQPKRRAQSCSTPTKGTFIKRSLGKHPILELSPKDTNSSTIHIIKARQSMKINRIAGKERKHSLNSSHDVSIDFYDKAKAEDSSNNEGRHRSSKQIHQFINFKDHKERYVQERLFVNQNEKLFELNETQPAKIAIPRLLHSQRSKKQPQTTKFRFQRLSPTKASPHITAMRTILQTIQQRSSIPSLEQSYLLEMNHIASKATLKSNIYDKNALTPLTEKYESMIFQTDRSRHSIRMANSQNLSSINVQTQEELLSMIISKLTMDNKLLERQYNALIEEQSFLKLQKQYDLEQFQHQLSQLQHQKSQYTSKLQHPNGNSAQPLHP